MTDIYGYIVLYCVIIPQTKSKMVVYRL